MSLPRYPKYRDSGVEWLGEVPASWGVARLRHVSQRYSGGTPDKGNPAYWQDGSIPWLNSGAVNDGIIREPSAFITEEAFRNSSAKWIPKGALVMALAGQGRTKGMVAQLSIDTTCNQSMAAIVPGNRVRSRFLFYWLTARYTQIRNLAGGDLRDGLNLELLGNIPCPIASLAEQDGVATFLDVETEKIDQLVEVQRRLIVLLQEKRQAAISHAVTKGLDSTAPMKNSGIAWLGKIPAAWTTDRLKRLSPSITVGIVVNPSDFVSDEGLPFIYGGDIREGTINAQGARRISEEASRAHAKTTLHAGDLLTVRVGAPGVTSVVPAECEGGNCASVMLTRCGNFNSDWLCHAMNSRMVRFQVECVQYGAAQEQFNISHAQEFVLAVPPREQQEEIALHLDQVGGTIDGLIAETERSISILEERRSALVSAAVTGQIDLRGAA